MAKKITPVKAGNNKKYMTLEGYIKGKRLNLDKLIGDSEFNKLLSLDVRAYNERIRYAEAKGQAAPDKVKLSDIKKQIKTGKMTPTEFKGFVNTISKGQRSRARKEQDVVVPTTEKRVREISFDTEMFRKLEKKLKEKYGEAYYESHKDVLYDLKDNLQELKKQGLKEESTNFYKVVKGLENNLSGIEKHNKLISEYAKTRDMNEALKKVYNNEIDTINKEKDRILREQVKKFFKNDLQKQKEVDNKDYEELRKFYEDAIGPLYRQDREKWYSPNFFKKREKVEDDYISASLVRKTIGAGSLKTSQYIDNFVTQLQRMESEGGLGKVEKDSILELINLIPKRYLGKILTDDLVKMEEWYFSSEDLQRELNAPVVDGNVVYNARQKGIDLLDNLKLVIKNSMYNDNWGYTAKQYADIEKLL